jgi:anaerobic magnesium-protoporphyrin IX monomethyl ester cyclase
LRGGDLFDIAVLVPFENQPASWVDPTVRAAFAPTRLVTIRARDRLTELIGMTLGEDGVSSTHRSLTAVTLATSLERGGIRWRVLDPGPVPLSDWRRRLEALRASRPRVVAISSTFVIDGFWLGALCELVRRILPEARLAVGGYYYATDAKQFLSLDADVLCVGEGEHRIVEIARAFRDGMDLGAIPGLYLRDPSGRIRYTGDAEPLRLDELPLPDWSLSARIEPPVDCERAPIDYGVETQRGCIFKCEFCTFRTLAAPVQGSVEHAVRAIRNAMRPGGGTIFVVDATGTSPRDRWRRILERLVAEGGSPLPISVYARVSDLDDDVCALMARAGVQSVRIGQETGDQRLLNEMRKGTRVDQIAPAIAALGRYGIAASIYFFYGFPGETEESLAATRRLLCTINDGHERSPVVQGISIGLFDLQNLAAVQQRDALKGVRHRFGWDGLDVTPARAAEAAFETYLALSRIPHAPWTTFGVVGEIWNLYDQSAIMGDPLAFFRWAKLIDRGIGLFAEQELYGKRPNPSELRQLRERILAGVPKNRVPLRGLRKARLLARHRITWRLLEEWAGGEPSIGTLTRLALGWEVFRSTGRFGDAYDAVRTGKYPALGFASHGDHVVESDAAAGRLIELGIATGRRRLMKTG